MAEQVYVAWVRYQRRVESMAGYAGFKTLYLPPPFQSKWLKPFGYIVQSFQTCAFLFRERPKVVWYQLPPNFPGFAIALMRLLPGGAFKTVADCHNATFRPPWTRVPGYLWILRSADLVLVHNPEVVQQARALGLHSDVQILEDPPASLRHAQTGNSGRPFVLIPCSFHDDEPVDVVIQAARILNQFDFKITGDRSKAQKLGWTNGTPPNVEFTGFLPVEEFDALLRGCTVLAGLTTREGIQLSVASEGVGAGKAMVLSDTAILREMFSDAALMTKNEPQALCAAIREAASQRSVLEQRATDLRQRRIAQWTSRLSDLMRFLALPGAD